MSHLVVTTVCIIYSDYLEAALAGGMDSVLGAVGGQMPGCEVTTEYVEVTAAPSVVVDIPGGSLFPACAEDNSCFDPHTVAVDVGAQVVWTNSDTVLHTVTDPAGAFDRWLLPGEEFAFTFDAPGTYMYGCVVHPWAGGTVVVGEDAALRLEPDTAVRAVEDFVTMYDSEGTAAFETVNGMEAEDIYPFAIDAGTLAVVAEGAFPQVVGLPAIFLHDADRPLAEILAELEESEGVWAEYVFYNPEKSSSEAKTSYLSLHDGYIFGSGYYTSPDVGATDAVDVMLRMYSTLGDRAFENFGLVPTGAFNAPFVLDADTLEVVAHANPDLSGGDVRDAMASGQSLEFVHDMLERHGSLWLSYPSADPEPGAEYTRAYLLLRDGYVFASGYGVDADSRLRSVADESVRLYEREGDAAFDIIASMVNTRQTVYDLQESKVLALWGAPQYRGLVVPLSSISLDQSLEEFLQLYEQGGAWSDRFDTIADGVEMRLSTWSILHDDRYWFAAARSYSPEAAAVAEVDAAIELYRTYGEAAFDRITWQAVDPAIVYPFVFDAETWQTVAHAGYPDRLGLLPAAIMVDHDLDEISEALAENEGVWVSYKFYNPVTDLVEYKRTWLSLYDGHIFAAGYYYGNIDNAEGVIAGAMAGYDANGEAAFEAINSEMSGSLDYSPLVLDFDTLDVVAHGGYPDLVGQNIRDIVSNGDHLAADIRASLMEDGDSGFAVSATLNPLTGIPVVQSMVFQLHDGYVFATAQPMLVISKQ